jgi:hypothetical protein
LAGAKLTIEAVQSKADHGPRMLGAEPPVSAAQGKFDHDLKARAGRRGPADTGTKHADRA